jgi:glycosyltransferase involved in cell wall biosynthesis
MITLALTNYNRFEFLLEAIANVKDHPQVSEIVISDDASTDGSYEKLVKYFKDEHKVKLFRNERNLDCYANKAKAVERVTGSWTILFDSDNVMPLAYLDKLLGIPTWSRRSAYLPVFATPHFDYRAFAGLVVTRGNVAQHLDRKNFTTALNTANYFFHRDEYLRVWDGSINPHTADSIYQNYRWLAGGNSLVFVEGLSYFHRVHPQSHYKINHKKTGSFARDVEIKLRQLR